MATRANSTTAPAVHRPPELSLSAPTPLPSLPTAFSRRRAIFGAVAVAAAPAAALTASAAVAGPDARLMAIADELQAIFLEAEAYCGLHPQSSEIDAELSSILDRIGPLETEAEVLAADTLAGVLAKVRVAQVPIVRECVAGVRIARSALDDLMHLDARGLLRGGRSA